MPLRWPWQRPPADIDTEAPELDALIAAAGRAVDYPARVEWTRDALRWIEKDLPTQPGNAEREAAGVKRAHARVRYLLQLTGRDSEGGRAVRTVLTGLADATDVESLSMSAGIPRRAGFVSEFWERLLARLLPRPDYTHEAVTLTSALLGRWRALAWLRTLPEDTAGDLARLFVAPGTLHHFRPQMAGAMMMLASEAQAVGLWSEMRARMKPLAAIDHPCARLVAQTEAVLRADTAEQGSALVAQLRRVIVAARMAFDSVHTQYAARGVSVDLVYRVERARAQLDRLDGLAHQYWAPQPERVLRAVVETAAEQRRLTGIGALFSENARLLSRRIADRNADTGTHYIAFTRAEYRQMLKISAGGGALMALAVYLKFVIVSADLAPFWEGLAASINYAGVFVLIALAHFTVATKQPAMTAPALATRMRQLEEPGAEAALVDGAAALVRSQAASVFGNLALVAPVVMAFAALWHLVFGAPPIGVEKAQHVLDDTSLIGPSFLYAIYTGVLLWASGLFAGWADNAFALRNLHEAIATNRRNVERLGAEGARKRADWWRENIAGLAGNIGLGVLLGMTPVLFHFFGIPMEVRHVTLSTGQVAAAVWTLGLPALASAPFWFAVAGLAVIGVLNVSVSFWLAMKVAMNAVGVPAHDRQRIMAAVRGRLVRHPRSFFLPPRESAFEASPFGK